MEAEIYFDLEVNNKVYSGMSSILRQPYGTDYSKEPVEAEKPNGPYKGRFNHDAFRQAAEDYYRESLGRAVSFGTQARDIVMSRNTFGFSKSYQIDIPD